MQSLDEEAQTGTFLEMVKCLILFQNFQKQLSVEATKKATNLKFSWETLNE